MRICLASSKKNEKLFLSDHCSSDTNNMRIKGKHKGLVFRPYRWLAFIIVAFMACCIGYSCSGSDKDEIVLAPEYRMPSDHVFVGDKKCQSCHTEQWDEWKMSHHHFAMAPATDETVLGDFNDVSFSTGYEQYRFFREDGRFLVEAPGPDGRQQTYQVKYTFGWEPLQQYLVDFGDGKYQALHASWDTERQQWFTLYPDEQIRPGDWLHWTGGAMNWNTMCADCHSTNLRQRYDPEMDAFDTKWSHITVSCEACHGPGADHVALMTSDKADHVDIEQIRSSITLALNATQAEELNSCAPCHSLRQKLTDDYLHGDAFLDHYNPQLPHPPLYHADGQILEEVFEYGSFLQSKMYMEGVRCTDCHNPHSLQLKANVTNNALCMQCHEPRYNTLEHHFHQINTEASQCVSCHMPGRYYMEIDFRRDHSFRVPRPDLSKNFGTPNACNNCHTNRSFEWASNAVNEWYGEDRTFHYSEVFVEANSGDTGAIRDLKQLIRDQSQPEIVRATAVWFLGQFPDRYYDDESLQVIREALDSESALIRSSAANIVDNYPDEWKMALLQDHVNDPVRSVRISVMSTLAGFEADDIERHLRQPFTDALMEYQEYLQVNHYFPGGQMNLGRFYERQGKTDSAISAYTLALEKDPFLHAARLNLAHLYNRNGNNDRARELLTEVTTMEPDFGDAWYSLGLILAEMGQLESAATKLQRAAELLPENSRVQYNKAIALQSLGRPAEAETAYLGAIALEPDHPDYHYGLVTLYLQQGEPEKALHHAEIMDRLLPDHPGIRQLLDNIKQQF
ncbi:MAG: hypothetical protein EA363_03105 [Balneolaceae bacterium]|nr:MAG: hypothetical protein EA363_03105 [Balneolaceae bacterium]